MSRIGKRPIVLNSQVDIKIDGCTIFAQGPKGKLQYKLSHEVKIQQHKDQLIFYVTKNSKESKALYGLSRTIVSNMVTGVSQGFYKTLKIQGVGYRAQVDSKQNLILNVGYSHPIYMSAPAGVNIEVKNSTEISIKGINKEIVGEFAAQIRSKKTT